MREGQQVARITGVIGVGAAALMVCSDLILVYAPVAAADYTMAAIAQRVALWRLVLGDYLGLVVLPFVLVGFYHVYLALAPAGRRTALAPVLALSFSYIVGAAFHRTVSITLLAFRQPDAQFAGDVERLYLVPLFLLLVGSAIVGSVMLFGAIWSRRSTYPRWVAWFSPLVPAVFLQIAARAGSPFLTGVLLPAGLNAAVLTFFAVSTVVRWHAPCRGDVA